MDFAQLPLRAMANVLGELGFGQLQRLLPDAPPRQLGFGQLPQVSASDPPLNVIALLPVEQAQFLAARAEGSFPLQPGDPLRKLVRHAVGGQMPDAVWRTRVLELLGSRLGGAPSHYLPDQFLPLVGELAWGGLTFRHRVATHVRRFLRRLVLFAFGDEPAALPSVKVFWLLIALTDVSQLPRRWLPLGSSLQSRATERLRREGQRQVLVEHWAGFWDQWLIAQALRQWPEACGRLDTPLRDALRALPILTETGETRPAGSPREHPPLDLAAPDWRNHLPSWFRPAEQ